MLRNVFNIESQCRHNFRIVRMKGGTAVRSEPLPEHRAIEIRNLWNRKMGYEVQIEVLTEFGWKDSRIA